LQFFEISGISELNAFDKLQRQNIINYGNGNCNLNINNTIVI